MHRLPLLLTTIFLSLSLMTSRATAQTCLVQTWLATLYYHADAYTDDFSPEASRTLTRHLNSYSHSDLRLNLRSQGISHMELPSLRLLSKLESIQAMERRSGAESARYLAQQIAVSTQLRSFKSKISTMECKQDPRWSPTSGANYAVPGAMPLRQFATIVSALAVSAMSFTYLATKYIYFLRRLTKRYIVRIDARITHSTHSEVVDIVDLSRRGAKIQTQHQMPRHTKVLLRFAGEEHTAQIVWQNTNFTGLRFVPALSPKRMAHVLATHGHNNRARRWPNLGTIRHPAP
ncbi:MAG: PilZ domain-containing protein [Thalassovita sp.]